MDRGQVMTELGKRWAALDAEAKAILESANAGCPSEQQAEDYFTFLLMHWRQVAINNPANTGLEIQNEVWQMWLAQGAPVVKESHSNDAEPKSKKQKKAPRDPRAPKRPPSSFLLFCQGQRSEGVQIGKAELSERWSALSEEERAPHVTRANTLLQEYKEASKMFKEGMVGKGVDGQESLNMKDAEEEVNTTEAAATVHSGQVDVEGVEADSDEKAD